MSTMSGAHDLVVVGASAGGVEALTRLVAGLPQSIDASIVVVLHMPPDTPSQLAAILGRAGALPAFQVDSRRAIEPGHIFVAPPNRHLVVDDGHLDLETGPRENSARPAIDVLFRSAARAYGRRVVGIILSGVLHDGALGLAAIKMRGGITIVQDPEDALFAGMPQSALNASPVDYCVRTNEMPKILLQLTSDGSAGKSPMAAPLPEGLEPSMHAADEPRHGSAPKQSNAASGLTCPECHGSLWEVDSSGPVRFECRVGHTYSVDALLSEQGKTVEAALWSAVNLLQERAGTFRRLSGSVSANLAASLEERAVDSEQHAETLLRLLYRIIGK
ncbi:MAG: chemotaxis protein CheB [Chloroflexi bacterium]|nr:chemotaxis protein CheB [Chloroflexota bacterium]